MDSVMYQGGKEHEVPGMAVDRWSFDVANGILKDECHVEGSYRLWWYNPDDDTFFEIAGDEDACEVSDFASEMKSEVELFVEHCSEDIVGTEQPPVLAPIQQTDHGKNVERRNSNAAIGGDGDDVGDDEDEVQNQSIEDRTAGIVFDDSEEERDIGLNDGFHVVLEPPLHRQKTDVTCSKQVNNKPDAGNITTTKTANVVQTGSQSVVDDDSRKNDNYATEDLNSSHTHDSDTERPPKYEKFRMEDLTPSYKFKKGLEFTSLQEFKLAITDWAVMNQRQHKYVKNDKVRVRVVCKENCGFLALVSKVGNKETYRMKNYVGPHKCGTTTENTNANAKWISKTVTKLLATRENITLREIVTEIRNTYSIEITIDRAWRAKKIAMAFLDGEVAKQYNMLWRYSEELRKKNKGNSCKINTIRIGSELQPRFDSFYFCFDGIKRGFLSACRPFIGVDGWHLKTKYGGTLLLAVGRDPNDQYFPLAFGVCQTETTESWRWFMTLLLADIGQDKRWVFISDHENGFIQVFKDMYQGVEHRLCLRHLYADFKKKFGGGRRIRELIIGAAKATYVQAWEAKMQELKIININAWDWLVKIPTNLWCKHAFSFYPKCDVLMNNLSAAFNDTILSVRAKPILTMCEWIRKYLMNRNASLRQKVDRWEHKICPNPKLRLQKEVEHSGNWEPNCAGDKIFEVQHIDQGYSYIVDIQKRSCTCNFWELVGIPCRHAVAALGKMSKNPEDFVHHHYSKQAYKRCYKFSVSAINGQDMWPDVDVEEMLPPYCKVEPRRAKKRTWMDVCHDPSKHNTKTTSTCTACRGDKHNASTCTSLQANQEAQHTKTKPNQNATVEQPSPQNATATPREQPNTSAAPPEVPICDDEVEFQMLAVDLAAAFVPTQSQPKVNAVANETVPNANYVKHCNTTALNVHHPDGDINVSTNDYILSQPLASDGHATFHNPKKKTKKCVGDFTPDEVGASATAEILQSSKKKKKKVVRQLELHNLRRSDRTRILKCKKLKGPGSSQTQPVIVDDDDDDDGRDESNEQPPTGKQVHGPSSQANLDDPKYGGCFSALRGLGFY